ncbi:hypothetical protein FXN63_02135 [Pigmentiphaga aceris]|uniref:Lipoprotein n=1 Tax=Pigmentiphaga aceris TaxID=1940612 RepID=A0A5C0AV32_9BURK|nr:hypothetical protein [Pigmentiphaga aceris]QEI04770.1 hypothetical protein FXN63_02135 [Pigmentiphaga aceris]
MLLKKTLLLKKAAVMLFSVGTLSACGQQNEPPSEAGMTLNPEQLKALNTDRSLENRRVSVVGYPLICNPATAYRPGEVAVIEIHAQQDCSSPQVAKANITIAGKDAAKPRFRILDLQPRNLMLLDQLIDNETTTFISDDYQTIPPKTSVRVTGVVTYPYGDKSRIPVLDKVALDAGF